MAYHRQQGVDTAIVRIFNTYGARSWRGRRSTFLRQAALEEKPLTVFGDGSQTRASAADDLVTRPESCSPSRASTSRPASAARGDEPARARRGGRRRAHPARSCSRPCRSTIRSAAAGHHATRQLLGWEPEITLEDGLRRAWRRSEGSRVRRRSAALAAALAACLASTASASPSMRLGIFDDGMVRTASPTPSSDSSRTRARSSCVNLWWSGPGIRVATRRPRQPADPNDPAYNWDTYDRTVRFSIVNGMEPVFSIVGTPPWANAAKGWNVAPTNARDLDSSRRRPSVATAAPSSTRTVSRSRGSTSGWPGTSRTTPSS